MRQREVEKALQLGENAGSIQLTLRNNSGITGNPMTLPLNVVEEMMNRKKTGRKVIDWTPSCTLYLEVCCFAWHNVVYGKMFYKHKFKC